ncbi:hypothetical protein [Paenibacillus daejeonensis]|uniref:hypothetical protein n=1 Tax=Paenibacillus daejeonensis TaxID=135193 RepID=UPI00036AF3DC|nr:hypothetical protein [Paenibacillus daejeonensis]
MSELKQGLDLERIIFIGRTYEEYIAMFNLTEADILQNEILDCPAGACSFTAYANQMGGDVTAVDLAFAFEPEELKIKGLQDIKHGVEQVEKVKAGYLWTYFDNTEALKQHRIRALEDSTADRLQHPSRYLHAVLPELPFADDSFDMTLSAHLLFMYSERLDLAFHQAALLELMRVTRREIRIFPLVDQQSEQSVHLDPILALIEQEQWQTEVCTSSYEFQQNANQYLRIYRP